VSAEHDGRGGLDALMAAIADEPLPDGARADAAFMAEYRSATADVALLREQLGVLAEALTEPARQSAARPAPVPERRGVRSARRLRPLALRAVGVAAAGALVFGAGWAVVQAGPGRSDDADDQSAASAASDAGRGEAGGKAAEDAGALLTDPGYLACTRLVVEGDVTEVRRLPGTTRVRVSLRVTRAYRPARSAPEVGFERERDVGAPLDAGDPVLVALARGTGVPDVWVVGDPAIAPEREALARGLSGAGAADCG
jgi:hypothetical protein